MIGRVHGELTYTASGAPMVTLELPREAVAAFPGWLDAELDVEIKRHRKRRSLDANAYMWVLCDKIAEKLKVSKESVYRAEIRDIAGNSTIICVKSDAAPGVIEIWSGRGVGWFAEPFDSKIPGCTNVRLYYGSSVYDSAQMSALIDRIVEDAREIGIETATPAELARIKEEWAR